MNLMYFLRLFNYVTFFSDSLGRVVHQITAQDDKRENIHMHGRNKNEPQIISGE